LPRQQLAFQKEQNFDKASLENRIERAPWYASFAGPEDGRMVLPRLHYYFLNCARCWTEQQDLACQSKLEQGQEFRYDSHGIPSGSDTPSPATWERTPKVPSRRTGEDAVASGDN
jgi:hypothetical protein